MEQTMTWPIVKRQLISLLQSSIPKSFYTNFTFDEQKQTLKYETIPMITILSISTGTGDLEFEMITHLRVRTKTNICLIIIDPFYEADAYKRFLPIVHTLYVNPWMDGFVMLEFEKLHLPRPIFKQFDALFRQNLTELNLVFVANFQFTASTIIKSLRPYQVSDILFDYRSDDYQQTLQGFQPKGTKWIKKGFASKGPNRVEQDLFQIQESSLAVSLIHRKIWRYYKTIVHKQETLFCMLTNTDAQRFALGFWQKTQRKFVVFSSFLEFYNYFKTRPQ